MKKLLLFDLDGTLLHFDCTISDYTLSVLKKCREKGFLLAIATARSEANSFKYISAVNPDIIISCDGALIRNGKEIIYRSEFTKKETRKMIDTALSLTNGKCEITVDTVEKHYWNYKVDPHIQSPDWGEVVYTDYKSFDKSSLKICTELQDESIAKKIASSVKGCDFARFANCNWYKFTCKNSTKNNAVKIISEELNIPLEDMIAFGDDYVDVKMLRLCGIGVAVENAVDEAKSAADFVTMSNNSDGVAKWLESYVL